MTNLKKLKRRAMLGDRQAQEECTRLGIVLRCPFCGGSTDDKSGTIFKIARIELYAHKRTGKCVYDGSVIYNLSIWNTRTDPPVGRCWECKNWCTGTKCGMKCACQERSNAEDTGMVFTRAYEFCKKFKPKEG